MLAIQTWMEDSTFCMRMYGMLDHVWIDVIGRGPDPMSAATDAMDKVLEQEKDRILSG